jgi:N-acetyl-1-D-myo-inositol-2-amino-2-deoxy-alpha-D-glucopyranoside deacetylase
MAAMTSTASRRLLLVHAHPDDETIGNGVSMARYVAEGAAVTLVTCTRGEEGEIIPPELAHLASSEQDLLGEYRVGELAAAMKALGVTDHRFLDQAGAGFEPTHYRDSGMAYGENGEVLPLPDQHPDSFARADLDTAAGRLAAVVRQIRPQVLVTYDPGGGYGHPDHVQAHLVAMRGAELAEQPGPGGEPWRVPKIYWNAVPRGAMLEMMADLAAAGENPFEGWDPERLPSMVFPDEQVTTLIDGNEYFDAKAAAMKAHRTQISVDSFFFALSNNVGRPIMATESYAIVRGEPAGERGADGRETDLFAGVA